MAAFRVQYQDPSLFEDFDTTHLEENIALAVKSMTTSNQAVAQTIHEGSFFDAVHGMTDITGFGFRGHLSEMLVDSSFGVEITALPVFPTSPALSDLFGYPLEMGKAAETAGAMLMVVDPDQLADFTRALTDRRIWWRDVGSIISPGNGPILAETFTLEEVDDY